MLESKVIIEELKQIEGHMEELTDLLVEVVDGGASIGFLPPLERATARDYWRDVIEPNVVLYVAKVDGYVAGTIQLHLSGKQNGKHRAEIAKLMTNPNYRRMGIGRTLMEAAEERAKQERRSLLVLDTREGDPSNLLYSSMGYEKAGRIPNFAMSASGQLDATIFYYKILM